MQGLHKSIEVRGPNECWPSSATPSQEYPRVFHNGRTPHLSRVVYEQVHGPIPEGLTIDHLCFNTRCCNPAHLEAVTQQINTLRGNAGSAINARKTVCPKCGGDYDSFVRSDGRTQRYCPPCQRETVNKAHRRLYAANRMKKAGGENRTAATNGREAERSLAASLAGHLPASPRST